MSRLGAFFLKDVQALPPHARQRYWRETFAAYTYLLPAALIIIAFHIIPVGYALFVSLHRWRILPESFVGLDNYARVLSDPDFWNSLTVTIFYVVGTVPLTLAISLFLACLLFQQIVGRGVYRTVYFLPYITSAVAASAVWMWIFNPNFGLLNQVLELVGIYNLRWLLEPTGVFELVGKGLGVAVPGWAAGPSLALVAIMIVSIWHQTGYQIVIFLAGLGNIPTELYEAAKIDGAGPWQLFRHITFPLLSPTTFFLLVVSIIGTFQAFNTIFVMTGGTGNVGGPLKTTQTVTILIFKQFFESFNMGYASAIAFVLFFIILSLTLLQRQVVERRVFYG